MKGMTSVVDNMVVWYRSDPAHIGHSMSQLGGCVVVRLEASIAILGIHVAGPQPVILGAVDALVEAVRPLRIPA